MKLIEQLSMESFYGLLHIILEFSLDSQNG